jgi:soluble P-type ATPase/Icc-related predicted phosphoesterase
MVDSSFTVVQISDTHFQLDLPESFGRFVPVRRKVHEIRPELTIVAGDVCNEGFGDHGLEELQRAKAQLDRIDGPTVVIPGNHDVGGAGKSMTTENLERWHRVFEHDHFCIERDRWMLIGLNSQLLATEIVQAAEQWTWIDQRLKQAESQDRLVAVFMHKLPFVTDPDEIHRWGWRTEPRRRIVERLDQPHVRLVSAAHLHWHHSFERGGAKWVTSPGIVDSIIDDLQFAHGGDVVGFLKYKFTPDGVTYEVVPVGCPTVKFWLDRNEVEIPGRGNVVLGHLVLDFNGTLSKDGKLLTGVAERLTKLAETVRITVMTADTFGTAAEALRGLPLEVKWIETGADKARFVRDLGADHVVAVGNGRNDVEMVRSAAIGIAVIGPEGVAGELIREADVVVNDVRDGLDLIANPLRLKATLRD